MIKTIKGLIVAVIISAFGFAAYAADSKKPTRILNGLSSMKTNFLPN